VNEQKAHLNWDGWSIRQLFHHIENKSPNAKMARVECLSAKLLNIIKSLSTKAKLKISFLCINFVNFNLSF